MKCSPFFTGSNRNWRSGGRTPISSLSIWFHWLRSCGHPWLVLWRIPLPDGINAEVRYIQGMWFPMVLLFAISVEFSINWDMRKCKFSEGLQSWQYCEMLGFVCLIAVWNNIYILSTREICLRIFIYIYLYKIIVNLISYWLFIDICQRLWEIVMISKTHIHIGLFLFV